MSTGPVVLQDIVLNSARGFDELLGHRLVRDMRFSVGLSQHPKDSRSYHTSISLSCSSGMSASFSPWNLGITSC